MATDPVRSSGSIAAEEESELPLGELIAPIFRRFGIIVRVVAVGVTAVALLAWAQPPVYKARATLMLKAQRAEMAVSPDESTKPIIGFTTDFDINSEVSLLTSPNLIREVLSKHYNPAELEKEPTLAERLMKLVFFPLRIPSLIRGLLHDTKPPTPLDGWVQSTARKLEVTSVGRSNLIHVSYTSGNPQWAAVFVNELLSAHLTRRAGMGATAEARQFFQEQRKVLERKLESATKALDEFRARVGEDVLFEDAEDLAARLKALESELSEAQARLAELDGRIAFLTQQLESRSKHVQHSRDSLQSPALEALRTRLVELQIERSSLLARFAPESSAVRDVDRQIAEAKKLLAAEERRLMNSLRDADPGYVSLESELVDSRSERAAVVARFQALQQQIDTYRDRMQRLNAVSTERDRLKNELATAKQSYATYLKKEEEARFSRALDESRILNLTIVEPATAPTKPEPSGALKAIFVGGFMSLLVGIALCYVFDRLDPTVKSAMQARRAARLPVLGEIPR